MGQTVSIERHLATTIRGRYLSPEDKIVPVCKFALVARILWPEKTAAHLAAIAGKDERTAKRWLHGEFDPPGVVIAAIIAEITKPR